jgi:hypothetical protein
MTGCDAIAALLAPHAAGELDAQGRWRVQAHLARCPACRQELARERQLRELAASAPPVRCPDHVTAAIGAAVDAAEHRTARPVASRRPVARRPGRLATWLPAAGLLTAAVLLALVLPRTPAPAPEAAPGPAAPAVSDAGPAPATTTGTATAPELQQARHEVAWALAFTADLIDRTEKRSLARALRLLRPAAGAAPDGADTSPAPGGRG